MHVGPGRTPIGSRLRSVALPLFAVVVFLGRSGGTRDLIFTPRQAQEGAELARWASKLDGSNGDVGLWGCSWLGTNQLETATRLGSDSPVKG